jgi:hypothetical protein
VITAAERPAEDYGQGARRPQPEDSAMSLQDDMLNALERFQEAADAGHAI